MLRLLFIDDDPSAQKTLRMVLSEDYSVVSAFTASEGIKNVQKNTPDVILLDINLPDEDGITVLEKICALISSPPVIMLTALSDTKLVVKAIQKGAYDYIPKPYDIKELKGTIRRALQNSKQSLTHISDPLNPALGRLIGESSAIQNVKNLILRYGPTDSPVLLQGESGTGKELVAEALHDVSHRFSGPFIAVNCGALPETLLETELFGSEKGAFTDAVTRPGSFERANGGTIFLDEICEMSPQSQVTFLRVLEQKEVTRIGGTLNIPLNIRVISATNRDCKEDIRREKLRADLYYRISVLPIEIPPLRERKEDILIIATAFAKQYLSHEAREKLLAYCWPGNVRELKNVIERGILLSEQDTIQAKDIRF